MSAWSVDCMNKQEILKQNKELNHVPSHSTSHSAIPGTRSFALCCLWMRDSSLKKALFDCTALCPTIVRDRNDLLILPPSILLLLMPLILSTNHLS